MNKTSAKLLLTFVFIARGTSFLFSKNLMLSMSPMNILSLRFVMSFIILFIIFLGKLRKCSRQSLKGGIILGVLYTICMTFEMYGLRLIDSGVSALIENMAIVLVPLYIAVFTKSLPAPKTVLCALLAVTGVGFLSLTQTQHAGAASGIILIICAAMTYALCIIATEKVTKNADPVCVGVIQIGVMGLLCTIVSLFTEKYAFPQQPAQWSMLLILALLCSCFGFVFQPVGQKYLPADTAAVFTVINPLTASFMGIIFTAEKLSAFKITGYILILGALLIFNLKKQKQSI